MVSSKQFTSLGFVGYGRFGKLLHQLAAKYFPDLKLYAFDPYANVPQNIAADLATVAASDMVVIAVPIVALEETIDNLVPYLKAETIIVDVCSVRGYPNRILSEKLPATVKIIGAHPLFGPNTIATLGNDISGLKIVLENVRSDSRTFVVTKKILQEYGLKVVEMNASDHDQLNANSQAVALLIASLLNRFGVKRSEVDTASFSSLMNFVEMVGANEQLLKDMIQFNPQAKIAIEKLSRDFETLLAAIGIEK